MQTFHSWLDDHSGHFKAPQSQLTPRVAILRGSGGSHRHFRGATVHKVEMKKRMRRRIHNNPKFSFKSNKKSGHLRSHSYLLSSIPNTAENRHCSQPHNANRQLTAHGVNSRRPTAPRAAPNPVEPAASDAAASAVRAPATRAPLLGRPGPVLKVEVVQIEARMPKALSQRRTSSKP